MVHRKSERIGSDEEEDNGNTMGTDIHVCVEVREWGQWRAVTEPNAWYDEEANDEAEHSLTGWLWSDRCYDLFAVLASVRNRFGFAGSDRGERVVPISEPRGLPYDVSGRISEESNRLGDDVHSRSWVTLRELLGYDWDQSVKWPRVCHERRF